MKSKSLIVKRRVWPRRGEWSRCKPIFVKAMDIPWFAKSCLSAHTWWMLARVADAVPVLTRLALAPAPRRGSSLRPWLPIKVSFPQHWKSMRTESSATAYLTVTGATFVAVLAGPDGRVSLPSIIASLEKRSEMRTFQYQVISALQVALSAIAVGTRSFLRPTRRHKPLH